MKPLPGDFKENWRTFLQVGDKILQTPGTAEQCLLITNTIKQLLNADAQIWFSSKYYPLPGEKNIPLVTDSSVPEIVLHKWLELQGYDQGRIQALDQLETKTYGVATELPAMLLDSVFPLKYQKETLGLLHLKRENQQPFTNQEFDFLEGMISHIAVALQTYRQIVLKNWRHDQLALVRSVTSKIANITDLDRLFHQITEEIQKTFDCYFVSIFTTEARTGKIQYRASCGINNAEAPASLISSEIEGSIIGHVASTGEELYVRNVKTDATYQFCETLPDTLSEIALPLTVESENLGVLDVQSNEIEGFHENDVLVLRSLADSIALAIEEANLFNNLQRRADQIAAVVEIGNVISSILDFETLMDEIVRIIQNRFGYPFVHIFTVQPDRNEVVFEAGIGSRSLSFHEKEIAYSILDQHGIIPWVARSNKSRIVNDVANEPLYRPAEILPQDTRSEIAVPLSFGGKVVGILDIQSDQPNVFDENDRFLFEALGATIATAIRNASLYRTEQWRRSVADGFRDIAGLISTNLELDQLLDNILDKLETYLPCDASAIWLIEQKDRAKDIPSLELAAVHCVDPQLVTRAVNQSVAVRQWLQNAMLLSEATLRKPSDAFCPLGVSLAYSPDYSSIAVPLQSGDVPLGILTLAHHSPGRYNFEAQAMTTTFASYAAVAIQNSRLFTEAQEQAWISTVLLQISETIQTADSTPKLFDSMIRHIPLLVDIKNCAFLLFDHNLKSFVIKRTYGNQVPPLETAYRLSEHPLLASLFSNFSVNSTQIQPYIIGKLDGFPCSPQEALMAFPITGRDRILGAFITVLNHPSDDQEEFETDKQNLAILQGIVNQVSVSLENLDLIETSQQEAYVTAALLQVAQAVVSLNELDDILATIVQLIPILVGIESCMIYLWDENRRLFHPGQINTGSREEDKKLMSQNFSEGEFKLLDSVRELDKIIHCPITDDSHSPLRWKEFPCIVYDPQDEVFLNEKKNWLIGFPLSVKGVVYGVLLVRETGGTAFQEKRLEILTGIAQQTALSIQNDQLNREIVDRERLDREFQLARQVQKTFLPDHLPAHNGWDLGARWQPARQVGGDFYDIFDLGNDQLGLVVADVSDKGMPAALYMTVTRTLIRASLQTYHTPAEVLMHVNNLLVMESLNGMFVTAFFAILSTHTGKIIYANAGHNQPLILRKITQKIESLEKGGMALGVMSDSPLENQAVTLHEGDALVLFTDGVTDSFSIDGRAFGEDHLRQALTATLYRTTDELLSAVEKAASDFRGGQPPSDDITLVGIKRIKPKSRKLFSH
jgi:phosphoserine phosphatase RsbU/P